MKTSRKTSIILVLAILSLTVTLGNFRLQANALPNLWSAALTIDGCCPDYQARTSSAQTSFTGKFTAESGYSWEYTSSLGSTFGIDRYSAVLSSNQYSYTYPPTGKIATAWEQFIFQEDYNVVTIMFVEEWLLSYPGSCPSGWSTSSSGGGYSNCFQNLPSGGGFDIPYTVYPDNLAGLSVKGQASSSGDTITFCLPSNVDNGHCFSSTVSDLLQLYNHWTSAEFNALGYANDEAVFNPGVSLTIQTTSGGGTVSCFQAQPGLTAESNDLNLATCSPSGSTITFSENNVPSVTNVAAKYCLTSTTCQVSGTIVAGDLIIVAVQVPGGTLTMSDNVITSWTMDQESSTTSGEDVAIFHGFQAQAPSTGGSGTGSDTFTISTTGAAGTMSIEVIEVPAGIAYTHVYPAWGEYDNGIVQQCPSGTSTAICTYTVAPNYPNIAIASIYATPGYNSITPGSGFTAVIGTWNPAGAAEYATNISPSTNFPAANNVAATHWADAGVVFA